MNEQHFDYLSKVRFKKYEPSRSLHAIARMSKKQIMEVVAGVVEATTYASRIATTPFEFSASGTSGATYPCSDPVCRSAASYRLR